MNQRIAVSDERQAWARYRSYVLEAGRNNFGAYYLQGPDATSEMLFRVWQAARTIRDSFKRKRRSYRKGGLNL